MKYYTIKELESRGININLVRSWIQRGHMKPKKEDGIYLINQAEYDKLKKYTEDKNNSYSIDYIFKEFKTSKSILKRLIKEYSIETIKVNGRDRVTKKGYKDLKDIVKSKGLMDSIQKKKREYYSLSEVARKTGISKVKITSIAKSLVLSGSKNIRKKGQNYRITNAGLVEILGVINREKESTNICPRCNYEMNELTDMEANGEYYCKSCNTFFQFGVEIEYDEDTGLVRYLG